MHSVSKFRSRLVFMPRISNQAKRMEHNWSDLSDRYRLENDVEHALRVLRRLDSPTIIADRMALRDQFINDVLPNIIAKLTQSDMLRSDKAKLAQALVDALKLTHNDLLLSDKAKLTQALVDILKLAHKDLLQSDKERVSQLLRKALKDADPYNNFTLNQAIFIGIGVAFLLEFLSSKIDKATAKPAATRKSEPEHGRELV
ncbi:MAG: hypothetical protein K0R66_645 [Gammaproteobacteria bacterium]|jgi:hypothetical protein|nr:hypothetical protein [Gammaproteobacteria bacterium]